MSSLQDKDNDMTPQSLENDHVDWERECLRRGVDIWMIRDNLKLSFERRVAQHQSTLDFIDNLQAVSSGKA